MAERREVSVKNSSNATKPTGAWEARRKIRIPALAGEAGAMALEAQVGSLPGVRAVAANVDKHQIVVRYDVTETDYLSVLDALKNSGFPAADNWWARRKRDWYEFTEGNARENAKAPPPACCNKPPK